jgi:hypothetical protein
VFSSFEGMIAIRTPILVVQLAVCIKEIFIGH